MGFNNDSLGQNKQNKFVNMLAAIAEITLVVPISYPIDLLKSRMQTNYYSSYKHFFVSLKSLEHNKTLYRGFVPLYTGLIIKQPMKIVAFETFANNPTHNENNNKILSFLNSARGSIAATLSGLVVGVPLSFIKTNYQVDNKYKLDWKTIKSTNIFNAWRYEVVKEAIGNIAYFTIYGEMRKYNKFLRENNVGITNFINGSVAGLVATFFAYPTDLIKARKQTIQYNYTLKQIVLSVGWENNVFKPRNFWKGVTPIYIRVWLFGGVGMYVYEKMRVIVAQFIN